MKATLLSAVLAVCFYGASASANDAELVTVESGFETMNHYDDVVTCESWQHKYNSCWVGHDVDRVYLLREHSKADCNRGVTWGYRDGYVWVDRGCRADFGIERYSRGNSVVCASNGYNYNTCDFGRPIREARLTRQLSRSACIYGRTWGFNRNYIWVDQGCRAEFDVYFGR